MTNLPFKASATKSFKDIPQMFRANYRVNVGLRYLEDHLDYYRQAYGIDLDADFQRAHVWTKEQRVKYLEYFFSGGPYGRELQFNCYGWDSNRKDPGPVILVDGKQRLTTLLMFLHDEIGIFGGTFFSEFVDQPSWTDHSLLVFMNNLSTKEQVLEWYLQINRGGTPHTDDEIHKVEKLLAEERLNGTVR